MRLQWISPFPSRRRVVAAAAAAAATGAAFTVASFASPGDARAATPISGAEVIEYNSGQLVGNESDNPSAALGVPNGDTSYGALTPFNPPFLAGDIVTVRDGGFIELRLSSPVPVAPGAMLGVFVNNGIIDVSPAQFDNDGNVISGGTGQAGTPAGYFSPTPAARVSVRGATGGFVPLDEAPITFDIPTNAYTDTAIDKYFAPLGSDLADPFKPFDGGLSDFNGLTYPQMLDLLDGSAGGTWLSLAGVPVDAVEYVRFEVPSGANYRLVLDALTASPAVPEPAAAAAAVLFIGAGMLGRRRTTGR